MPLSSFSQSLLDSSLISLSPASSSTALILRSSLPSASRSSKTASCEEEEAELRKMAEVADGILCSGSTNCFRCALTPSNGSEDDGGEAQGRGDGDDELGTAVFGLLGELGDGVEGVGGGGDGAEGEDGEEAGGEAEGVGGEDEDDVSLSNAEGSGRMER